MKVDGMRKISYGMYVISARLDDKFSACLVNTVFQITADPVIFAVSVSKNNYSHNFIESSKKIAISVLTTDADMKFIGNFGFRTGRDFDKFANVKYKLSSIHNLPIMIENTCALIEANVINQFDMLTHTIFFAKVDETEVLNGKTPMTYAYYHDVIKGKTAKNAPTYSAM